MFVDGLLAAAKANLVTIAESAPLVQAASLLRPGTDILVVCNLQNELAGVVTKTDVVRRISHCQGANCTMALDRVMSREVFYCKPGDSLQWVWNEAKERRFKNIPLVDTQLRPIGLVTARDMNSPEFRGHPRVSFPAVVRTRRVTASRSGRAFVLGCRTFRCSRTRPALPLGVFDRFCAVSAHA